MQWISAFFSNTLVAFIFLVGLVIFVHELGHFLVGRVFRIGVEEFSIGFGPPLFEFRRGITVYKICWLPLGGYVRFYGADPESPAPANKGPNARPFLQAPVYQRALVSTAGPLANVLFSFVLLCGLFWQGIPVQPAVVSVQPQSLAAAAGLKTGDTVVSVDGFPVATWNAFSKHIRTQRSGKALRLRVLRQQQVVSVLVTPAVAYMLSPYGKLEPAGKIGVSPLFSRAVVDPLPGDFLSTLGLQRGDRVVSIQGEPVLYAYQMYSLWERVLGAPSEQALAIKLKAQLQNPAAVSARAVPIVFERAGVLHTVDFSLITPSQRKIWGRWILTPKNPLLWEQSTRLGELVVSGFSQEPRDKPAVQAWQSCGLAKGMALVSLQGHTLQNALSVYDALEKESLSRRAQPGRSPALLQLGVINQQGQTQVLLCQVPFQAIAEVPVQTLTLPVSFLDHPVLWPSFVEKSDSLPQNFSKAYETLKQQMGLIYRGLGMLLSGDLPLSNLGGPLAVASIAGDAAKAGLLAFFFTMSFISVNIGIINMLPLPALDGGALLMNIVEACYGKALSLGVQRAVQKSGVILLLGLFVCAFYNDVMRLFGR